MNLCVRSMKSPPVSDSNENLTNSRDFLLWGSLGCRKHTVLCVCVCACTIRTSVCFLACVRNKVNSAMCASAAGPSTSDATHAKLEAIATWSRENFRSPGAIMTANAACSANAPSPWWVLGDCCNRQLSLRFTTWDSFCQPQQWPSPKPPTFKLRL